MGRPPRRTAARTARVAQEAHLGPWPDLAVSISILFDGREWLHCKGLNWRVDEEVSGHKEGGA